MNKLAGITSVLGQRYWEWKASEESKNFAKEEFFAQATEELAASELATQVVTLALKPEDDLREIVAEKYPRMILKEVKALEDGQVEIILEENPAFKPYTFVNPEDRTVYSRSIRAGKVSIDDDSLAADNPDLYEQITIEVTERQLRPLEELTPEQVAEIQQYIYEGKPQVVLSQPRTAKPEELEG
jgi:hypothetical protein